MKKSLLQNLKNKYFLFFAGMGILFVALFSINNGSIFSTNITYEKIINAIPVITPVPVLDTADYDKRLNALANNPVPPPPKDCAPGEAYKHSDGAPCPVETASLPLKPAVIALPPLWPVKTVYPNVGAILPFNRIIAYYGNLYSKKMGVLGEYPEDVMFAKLAAEIKKWNEADPNTPALPALHYIAVVAQKSKGADGKYRFRMPDSEIDKVLVMAAKINAIVFLDIQVGLSTIQTELPIFEKYLKLPQVHLGIDPEFSMKTGARPGTIVGTYDAEDINFAANYLAALVRDNNLPPKVLVIHRYTKKMVTNYENITPLPEVQIVMHMDGWGVKATKLNTYEQFVYKQPVQFAGFKLFYKNDLWTKGTVLMTPADLLELRPRPIYIQFQ